MNFENVVDCQLRKADDVDLCFVRLVIVHFFEFFVEITVKGFANIENCILVSILKVHIPLKS